MYDLKAYTINKSTFLLLTIEALAHEVEIKIESLKDFSVFYFSHIGSSVRESTGPKEIPPQVGDLFGES